MHVLSRGQSFALSLMQDSCTVGRVTGETTDPDTGAVTPVITQTYAGRCRIQQRESAASARDVGEAELLLLRLEVQLPMTVTGCAVDDIVTVTASVHDPDLVGRRFRIRDLFHKTHAVSRRVGVVEVTS